MTHKEYKRILNYEIFRFTDGKKLTLIKKIRYKYFTPNSNCVFLARRMWYLFSCGGLKKAYSRVIYIRIMRRYGCCIFPNAKVGKGFWITHPVGIVIGKCDIGENFIIYQNTTVGVKRNGDVPVIGDNVVLCTNSVILGSIKVADNITIGASSLVINDLSVAGTYVGCPVKRIK